MGSFQNSQVNRPIPSANNERRTNDVNKYESELYRGVKFIDIPGIGSTNYDVTVNRYWKMLDLDKYDVYIMVTKGTFFQKECELYKKIVATDKPVYIVTTRFADALANARMANPAEQNLEETCHQKAINQVKNELAKIGFTFNGKVYCIENSLPERFDLEQLKLDIANNLTFDKKMKLFSAFVAITYDSLQVKTQSLRYLALAAAAISGASSLVPIPGVSIAADMAITMAFISKIRNAYGLTPQILACTCQSYELDYDQIITEMQYFNDLNIKDTWNHMFGKCAATLKWMSFDDIVKAIPGIGSLLGSLLGGVTSFTGTFALCYMIISEFESDAKLLIRKIQEKRR